MAFLDRCLKAVQNAKKLQTIVAGQTQPGYAAAHGHTDFSQLLTQRFPGYELRQNLTPAQLIPGFSAGSVCSRCGAPVSGRFCTQCGSAAAQSDIWYCSCGSRNELLFCTHCGKKRPPRAAKTDYAGISYALYQDGQPKLAILLIPSNEWNSSAVVSTMAACKSADIPCQRYFIEFRNREDYVEDRVRQALR